MLISQALNRLVAHDDLSHDEMAAIMRQIMAGDASPIQTAGFLMALRVKSETTTEIAAAASVMREFASHVDLDLPHLVDICGTGGDGAHTFNISTTAMFVVAAAGAVVAKHGGRSVSSSCGSADILERLGANIQLSPAQVATCIRETGVGFMFAPNHHAAMKHIAPVRKELGVRTIFNILGPLTNPAGAKHQLMGVFHQDLAVTQAEVLKQLGSTHVLIVHAKSGLDEIALSGETVVAELKNGQIQSYPINAQQFGFPVYTEAELRQGLGADSAEASERLMREALNNTPGPARDIVAINAAGALLASDRASTWEEAVHLALQTLASGAARKQLDVFVSTTQRLAANV